MQDPELTSLLKEIRDLLRKQQQLLEEIHSSHLPRSLFGKTHWRMLIILALSILIVGSFGAYQYYRVLQSIIDQFPR